MSGKKSKKARRIARRVIAAQWRTDLDFLQSLPFRSRLGICLNIMFRFGYKRNKACQK